MAPLTLSVHMSNYNDSHVIGGAIEAICTQSRPPDEFIIVDDGSTDDSLAVIQEYARRFPIIRLVHNDRNMGVVYTINRGLRLASKDFIYFASANDRVEPGFFEKSLALLESNPHAQMCCTSGKSIYADTGQPVPDRRKKWLKQPGFLTGPQVAEKLEGHSMHGASYVTRRSCMIELGGYPAKLKWHTDYFLHHMIAFRYGTCFIPEELVTWRYEPGKGYSSNMRHAALQVPVFIETLRLLLSPEFSDLTRRVVRGRFLALFMPVLSISAILSGFHGARVRAPSTSMLAFHLLQELGYRITVRSPAWKIHVATGIVVNRFEQLYAHAFAMYDRARKRVRRRLNVS